MAAIEGLRQASWADGHLILVAQTMNNPEMDEKTIRTMVEKGTSALIYVAIFTRRMALPAWLDDLALPVVLLNCFF